MNKLFSGIAICLVVLTGCNGKQKEYTNVFNDPLLYAKTVKDLNNVVMENNFPPIIASRNYVYACIAGFEVMALGDNRFQSLSGQIKHLPPLPAQDTNNVNFQYAAMLAFCKLGEAVTFPEGSMEDYVVGLDSMADASGMT